MSFSPQLLAQLPLFANLTACELDELAAALAWGHAPAGTVLVAEAAPPGSPLFVLLTGSVATEKTGADGRRHTVNTTLAPGVFGEMDVMAARPTLAATVAREAVSFATLSGDACRAMCTAGRPAILKVLVNLTAALRYRSVAAETRRVPPSGALAQPPSRLGAMRSLLYAGWDSRRRN